MQIEKVVSRIKKNKSFLLTTHTNMEGDALGSTLALYRLLRRLKKNVSVVCEDDIPYGYGFLPDLDKVEKFHGFLSEGKTSVSKAILRQRDIKFDSMIVLDCSDLGRCGQVAKINVEHKPVINIDHHISNVNFGYINWVDPHASSCSEMIYRLYKKMAVPFDKDSALLLYVGILTDTGSFRYPNTNPLSHSAAAELMGQGLDVSAIHRGIYESIPFEDIKLLFKVLPGVKCADRGRVVWFEIRREILSHKKVSFDLSEHILSLARSVKGAEVALLFKENLSLKNQIRVNFRSRGRVDVNKVAKVFGGGGHKTAAGATIRGTIASVRKKVLEKIHEEL